MWICKGGYRLQEPLRSISSKQLIIGHICNGPNEAIAARSSWQELTERDVMKFLRGDEEVKAIQYFFTGEDVLSVLNDPASGIVYTMHDYEGNMQDILK